MAPAFRIKELQSRSFEQHQLRKAAVLILCYPSVLNQSVYFSMIQRPHYEGVHSGQIALPGGKAEPEDKSMQETALRETEEEIGVPRTDISTVKAMTRLYVPPSNYWVYPFVGFISSPPRFIPQLEEVADILEIPLTPFLDGQMVTKTKRQTSYAGEITVPAFQFQHHMIWGATAMIMSEFREMVLEILDQRC